MDYHIIKLILYTLAIGIMIGLQRSLTSILKNEQLFMGTRTFALIAIAGFLSGWLESKVSGFILVSLAIISTLLTATYY